MALHPAAVLSQAPPGRSPTAGSGRFLGAFLVLDLANVPTLLLGLRYHEPYFHDGSARNLMQVFVRHALVVPPAPPGTIATRLDATERRQLAQFLLSLDGSVPPFKSATDAFLDGIID